jgi:hypothetical protein
MYVSLDNHPTYRFNSSLKLEVKSYFTIICKGLKCMYLSVIFRHTLISSSSRIKIFILRSFRNLSFNRIWLDQNPTTSWRVGPLILGLEVRVG